MSDATRQAVEKTIRDYQEPYGGCDLYESQAVESLEMVDGRVELTLALGFPSERYADELRSTLSDRIEGLDLSRDTDYRVRITTLREPGGGPLEVPADAMLIEKR